MLVLPLYAVEAERCADIHYPALAGLWVVHCESGDVDRAFNLETRQQVVLKGGVTSPALAPGVMYGPTAGLWTLPSAEPTPLPAVIHGAEQGPPATDGAQAALLWSDHLEFFPLSAQVRTRTPARPHPGSPAAVAGEWVAWTEADSGALRLELRGPARASRSIPGAWGVAGSGPYLGWIEPGAVVVWDTRSDATWRYPAETGFNAGLTLWGPIACWEDRAAFVAGTGDIDVSCSDGWTLARPGHQLWPGRYGPYLIFREGEQVMVAIPDVLALSEEDPRATLSGDTVRWAIDWPVAGWRVERAGPDGWVAGEALPVGPSEIDAPRGVAVRLVRP